jgi:hypothetical protein
MADIKIDDSQLKDMIAKAVIDSLTPESRVELITNAVKQLLARKTGNAYDSRSELQVAFDNAVRDVAREIALEHMRSADMRAAIDKIVAEAVKRALNLDSDAFNAMADKMADQIRRAITGERY